MLEFFLTLIVGAFVYWEFLYPYVLYPLYARKRKGGSVKVVSNFPLGLRVTRQVVRNLQRDKLLIVNSERELKMGSVKTFWREGLFKWMLVTREPENLKAVLATKFADYELGERTSFIRPIFGTGIFTQDGPGWKHSRTMLRPQFSKEQISRLTDLNKHADALIAEFAKHNFKIEIQHFFHLLTMDTATEFLFGESVESLKFSENSRGSVRVIDPETGNSVSSAEFVESYTFLNRFALQKMVFNDLHWLVEWCFPQKKMHLRRAQVFIDHYVRHALDVVAQDKAPEDNYIFSYELAKSTQDPLVIRDQIFNILIAGRDTTASTLAYSFYFFAQNPDMWELVKEDVWSAFPDGPKHTQFTYEGLRKLRYLPLYVKEVLRLSPAVPLNVRTANKDTMLPRGGGPDQSEPVFVPKGTNMAYSVYVLHRDKEIYGPDADKFRPERWAPENKVPDSPMYSWGYIPFNAGPRICLGQQFALTELYLTIAKLALTFDKVLPGPNFAKDLTDRQTLTAMVGGVGVPVELVPYQ